MVGLQIHGSPHTSSPLSERALTFILNKVLSLRIRLLHQLFDFKKL